MAGSIVILGAGAPNGLGGALARRFANAGHPIIVSGRTQAKIDAIADEVTKAGGTIDALEVDVTSPSDQDALFTHAKAKGPIAGVLYNAGNNAIIPFEDLTSEQFEDFWRVGCFGGFLAAERAVPLLAAQGEGSLIFTGASGSLRGKAMFGHFASAKAALRNLAQAIAREYGPKGVHVAHVIVDGVINGARAQAGFQDYLDSLGPGGTLQPDDIAEAFYTLHTQPRSAWTHELDVRPFKENW